MWKKVIITGLAAVGALLAQATPAQQEIESMSAVVERNPDDAGAMSRLATAYSRRARETGDPQYYAKAMEIIAAALKISPGNYEALRAKTWTGCPTPIVGDGSTIANWTRVACCWSALLNPMKRRAIAVPSAADTLAPERVEGSIWP